MIKSHFSPVKGKWLRVENPVGPGTPDVHYCVEGMTGWLELKEIPAWPKRSDTPVRLPHYTKEQRLWIMDYASHGGRVHLLLRIARPKFYLLFGPEVAVHLLGEVPEWTLRQRALVTSGPTFVASAFLDGLLDPNYGEAG
jgi:hypothetical protein